MSKATEKLVIPEQTYYLVCDNGEFYIAHDKEGISEATARYRLEEDGSVENIVESMGDKLMSDIVPDSHPDTRDDMTSFIEAYKEEGK